MDLSPPATMTAALVGVSAAGVVGALVAVPLLGAAKAVYLELRSDRPQRAQGPVGGTARRRPGATANPTRGPTPTPR